MADACLFLLNQSDEAIGSLFRPDMVPLVNIGCGEDLTIRELAELVAEVVGFKGRLGFDATKPDGTPRKLLDASRLRLLGWKAETGLKQGLSAAYQDFRQSGLR